MANGQISFKKFIWRGGVFKNLPDGSNELERSKAEGVREDEIQSFIEKYQIE
jgi:hypothetical protein